MSLTNKEILGLLHEDSRERQQLIERCQQGDRRAFNQCVLEYQSPVFNYVSHMAANKREAHNIMKDTFVEAFRTFPEFQGTISLDVWLFKIAQNQIEKMRKKHQSWYRQILSIFQTHHAPQPTQEDNILEPTTSSQATSECSKIASLFLPYIDGELGEAESREIEEHLITCEVCRQELENVRHTDDLLHVHSVMTVPPELRVQINAAIDDLQRNQMMSFWQKLAARFPVSGGQVAAVAASIALMFAA